MKYVPDVAPISVIPAIVETVSSGQHVSVRHQGSSTEELGVLGG